MSTLPKLHGFSLGFCVRDILDGNVQESQVLRISTETCAKTNSEWIRLVAAYSKTFWEPDPESAAWIVARLLDAGRIEQPRTQGSEPYPVPEGFWAIVPLFEVGKTYRTIGGDLVKIVAENTRRGYETVQGDDCGHDGILGWRYNRLGDLGRATGCTPDDPNCLVPGAVS